MGHAPQIRGAWHDGGDSCYNYDPVFQWAKDYISSADVAVANLEVTLAGAPYTGYPQFSSPDALAKALQNAGFNVLVTANNHSVDRGKKGLERTIDVLDSLEIMHTGIFKNADIRENTYPLIVEKNNFKLAFLNYSYGTNGIAVEAPNIVNLIDTVKMAIDLAKARELQADFIITFMHWGDEYQTTENAFQRGIADFLARNGSDLIVGAHPHVIQPFAKLPGHAADSVLVAYSLGNFISNQRDRYRDGGIAFEVNLIKTDHGVTVQSHRYEPFWLHRYSQSNVSLYRLIPVHDFLVHPERYPLIDEQNKKALLQFHEDTKKIIGY
jgi:poly-gamma-glutamate synthesis protein (capsule biosynthesis protein)